MKNKSEDKLSPIFLIIILLLPLIIILTLFFLAGPTWDLIAHYLNGKTFLDFVVYHNTTISAAFAGELANSQIYYFEPYREPLISVVLAILSIFSQKPLLIYLVIAYAALILVLLKLSKELKLERLIVFTVFLNLYIVYFFFFVNGSEVLCIIFVLLGIIYLLKNDQLSGLFFGIAALGKYPALDLLPMVFLLGDKKKIGIALFLEFIVTLPWLIFNYLAYGNPLYSYYTSILTTFPQWNTAPVSPIAISYILVYPLAFIAAALIIRKFTNMKIELNLKLLYKYRVYAAFLILSFIGYFLVLPYHDVITQARYGYIFVTAMLLISCVLLNDALKDRKNLKYAFAAVMIISLILGWYVFYSQNTTMTTAYYNPNNPENVFMHAGTALSSLGFNNCSIISNAWVLMIYDGYNTYSPYVLQNSTITPTVVNLTGSIVQYHKFVQEEESYPIVVFKYAGVSESNVTNLNSSKLAYTDANISIYLPKNVSCYR